MKRSRFVSRCCIGGMTTSILLWSLKASSASSMTTTTLRRRRSLREPTTTNTSRKRQRQLSPGTECTLYLALTQYNSDEEEETTTKDDLSHDEERWFCEFDDIEFDSIVPGSSRQTTTTTTTTSMRFAIEGLDSKFLEERGAISGETVLKLSEGYLLGTEWGNPSSTMYSSRNNNNNYNNNDDDDDAWKDPTLVVPSFADIELVTHTPPSGQRRKLNRLAPSKMGTLKTLVVLVEGASGQTPTESEARTRNNVFGDDLCLKNQIEGCSHGQLTIEPYEGPLGKDTIVTGGVTSIRLDVDPEEGKRYAFSDSATAVSKQVFGANFTDVVDLVLYCFPPGTGDDWIGFAFTNGYQSFYNNKWCGRVSLQMHEVGHNLGLAHSGERRISTYEEDYQDQSGMMGFSFASDDFPRMCFNPAKNWQLGWYSRQAESLNPTTINNNNNVIVFNGICDYKVDAAEPTNNKLVVLRLEQSGNVNNNDDYYVGYNRACGANNQTLEDGNAITIIHKPSGGPDGYGQSWKDASLWMKHQVHVISDFFGESDRKSFVRLELLEDTKSSSSGAVVDAPVEITTFERAQGCPGGRTAPTLPLVIDGQTDKQPHETSWSLRFQNGGTVAMASNYRTRKETFRYATEVCLDECYVFEIRDAGGNGLASKHGGFIQLSLNGTRLWNGADDFGDSSVHEFCVGAPVAAPPTMPPVAAPPPGNCENKAAIRRRKNKKNCDWVAKKKTKKRCNKKKWKGKKLRHWCPLACGTCTKSADEGDEVNPRQNNNSSNNNNDNDNNNSL